MCDHVYRHAGLQYADGAHKLPGSGATRRYYAQVFFCEKCLDMKAVEVNYGDTSSYEQPRDGATRGERKIIVPERDMTYGRY